MTDREFAEWFVEMVELCEQLPEEYLQDWKNDVKETIAPEKWDNAEKIIDAIWKYRTSTDEEFFRLKKALKELADSSKAVIRQPTQKAGSLLL